MKEAKPFFGQIWRKDDIVFQTDGLRDEIVQTHNIFTDNAGGVVNEMQLSVSSDKLTVYVKPGEFYSSGDLSATNNNGGGERGRLFSAKSFTSLPETAPFQGVPTYLLVYAKVVNSQTNPDPLSAQNLVTSRNIDTGENVPTRSYNAASIIVSNPIVRENVNNINGVPLALLQINYSGTTKVGVGGTINVVDESVRRNYVIANTVDIYNNRLLESGVDDQFITNRMIASGSVTGDKFADNSITSGKISIWDGATAYDSVLGSGIANQHLKDQVVTTNKINYQNGLNGFQVRNRLFNSSFETISGTSIPGNDKPAKWDSTTTGSLTFIDVVQGVDDPSAPLFGQAGLQLRGGQLAGAAQAVSVSQIVDFGESLKDKPLSAFFWAKETNSTVSPTGNTGLKGTIEFLSGGATQQTDIFTTVPSGVGSDYLQYSSASGITYTGTATCDQVKFTIGGVFNQAYFVDGAFLGETDLIPNYDINPSEYILIESIDANLISGTIGHPQIAPQAIWNNNIASITGGVSLGTPYGIANDQIQTGAVTPDKITGPIPASKIDPLAGLVPIGAIILWDGLPESLTNNCPAGYTEVFGLKGAFPIGVNDAAGSSILAPAVTSLGLGGAAATKATGGVVRAGSTDSTNTNHRHSYGDDYGPDHDLEGTDDRSNITSYSLDAAGVSHSHTDNIKIPFYSVYFCRKNP